MKLIDRQFLETPWYGSRQMARWLRRQGRPVGRHRVRRLMRKMRLAAIYQPPRTSKPNPQHKIHPYLLKDLEITRPNHVWCTDITYIPMRRGFLHLVAIMERVIGTPSVRETMARATRKVLAWRLSNTMDADFCIEALQEAMARYGKPEIFNTDSKYAGASVVGRSDAHSEGPFSVAGAAWCPVVA